jgi:hypothetical protein
LNKDYNKFDKWNKLFWRNYIFPYLYKTITNKCSNISNFYYHIYDIYSDTHPCYAVIYQIKFS